MAVIKILGQHQRLAHERTMFIYPIVFYLVWRVA